MELDTPIPELAATAFTASAECTVDTPTPIDPGEDGATEWTITLTGCPEGPADLGVLASAIGVSGEGRSPSDYVVGGEILVDRSPPTVTSAVLDTDSVVVGGMVTIAAVASDATSGVAAAEFRVSYGIDDATLLDWSAMTAVDGTFGSEIEAVAGSFVAPDVNGVVSVCVRASDRAGQLTEVPVCQPIDIRRMRSVTVTLTGAGMGDRVDSSIGLTCAWVCSQSTGDLRVGTFVELTAVTGVGRGFVGWSGPCTGSGAICAFTVSDATSVTATFVTVVPPPVMTLLAPATPTRSLTLTYGLVSSPAISRPAPATFVLRGTAGSCSVTEVTSATGAVESTAWTVRVGGCSDGSVILALGANSVAAAGGPAGPAAEVTAATVIVDRAAPVVGRPVLSPATAVAGATVTMKVSVTDGAGVKAVRRSVNNGALTVMTATDGTSLGSPSIVAWSSFTAPGTAGVYPVCAEASDLLDTTSGSICVDLTVGTITRLTYTGPLSITTGTTATITARLTGADGVTPIANRTITFVFGTGNRKSTKTATTNASGVASTTWSAPTSTGSTPLSITHAADASFSSASASATLAAKTGTTLTYGGVTTAALNASVTLTATLRTSSGTLLSNQTVSFTWAGTTKTATTNSSGVASTSWTAPGTAGTYAVLVSYAGANTYMPSSTTATVTVQ